MFFKEWYRKKALKKISSVREAKFVSYADISSIAFIFNLSEENILPVIERLLTISESDNIKAFGVAVNETKQLPNIFSDDRIVILGRKELGFYGVPNISALNAFISGKYDLLIDFSSTYRFVNEYLSKSVNAYFKIGKINYENSPYDFVLKPDIISNNDSFLDSVYHYLSSIDFHNDGR